MPDLTNALVYYVVTYSVATIGAFAVLGAIETRTGSDFLADLPGLLPRDLPALLRDIGVVVGSKVGKDGKRATTTPRSTGTQGCAGPTAPRSMDYTRPAAAPAGSKAAARSAMSAG